MSSSAAGTSFLKVEIDLRVEIEVDSRLSVMAQAPATVAYKSEAEVDTSDSPRPLDSTQCLEGWGIP